MNFLEKTEYELPAGDHQRLKKILGREPKTLERVLALALWNEHCSYRSSRKHLKKFQFPTKKKISGLSEQAGIVDLGEGERVSFKMESHNHPSFIIPYHGAATGVGGILRDIFAMNARPIALADFLCFGSQKAPGNPDRVNGVIRGIGDYGNCIGIPTITGRTEFSSSYDKNILVNAMALGYLGKKTKAMNSHAKGLGNFVVYVGSRTGRDGILGADMASRSFEEEGEERKTTVQVGDPFLGKQLMEACLLAMEKNLVLACQDMGAAGLTCSSFEMSEKSGQGLSLHLDKTPLRDKSMGPAEILLSESQERMLFICEPKKWESLKKLFEDQGLEICILGEVLKEKEMEIYWKGDLVLKIDPGLFTVHAPLEDRDYVFPEALKRTLPEKDSQSQEKKDIKKTLLEILSSAQGRSREFIYRQYDQRVGTRTLKDSSYPVAVVELPESGRELGMALGCRPYLMSQDTEQGAKDAVFYPALELSLRGFQPWAVTDCLNFGNPEKREIMGEFVLSVESISKACETLDTPIVSGNVSFYNETEGKNIPPTPAIGLVALKENKSDLASNFFQKEGERVYLLYSHQFFFPGAFKDFFKEKSPSAYGALQEPLVKLFLDQIRELSGKVSFSASSVVGKFGLAYTLSRMLLGNKVGFSLEKSFPFSLFEERLYEVVVSLNSKEEEIFKKEMKKGGMDFLYLGKTNNSSDLLLKGELLSYKEMSESYFKKWPGDLSS